MKNKLAIFVAAALLGGCSGKSLDQAGTATSVKTERPVSEPAVETTPDATSTAATVDGYKKDIAERIVQVNSTKVYTTRPQALLRSVIVVKYVIDGSGNLVRSEIIRTNRDHANEATAMATLKKTAPFPKPPSHLLRHNRLELSESWLFNSDGRFQLRSIALPQMDQ
jgi:protein TonB